MVTLRPGPHIRHTLVEDHLVVLDLTSESYVLFDPVAASMWREQLACGSRATALGNLARQYTVGESELAGDFDAFLGRCQSLGYLAEFGCPAVAAACRPASPGADFEKRCWCVVRVPANAATGSFFSGRRACRTNGQSRPNEFRKSWGPFAVRGKL
jgi:hypothetical protein